MKNKKLLLLILFFVCFFSFNIKVNAIEYHNPEEYLCGKVNSNELLSRIRKVKTNYELVTGEDGGKYFRVRVTSFQPDLVAKIYGINYSYESYGDSFYTTNKISINGGEFPIVFYGGINHPCADVYIAKRTIKIPKYNIYSELDACIEYEEFPLCAKYYDGTIGSASEFNDRLQKWIEENNVKPEEIKITIWDQIKDFIEDHQFEIALTIFLIAILLIAIVVRKVIRRIKRQKIKFRV